MLLGVSFGNFPYALAILFTAVLFYACVAICHRAGKDFSYKFITVMVWVNFALHFLKQLNPFYAAEWPLSLARSSGENLCAVLVILTPFLWHFGNVYVKDYMYYMGIVSTLVILLYPTSLVDIDIRELDGFLEYIRFYSCHLPLLVVAVVMVREGFHTLDYHRLWAIPIMFCLVQALIFLNGLLLNLCLYHYPWDYFFSVEAPEFNSSFTFGPGHMLDPVLGWLYPYLPPYLMTYRCQGEIRFTPVIYLFLPICLLTAILGPLFAYPFERHHMKADREAIKQKIRMAKEKWLQRR